MKQQDIKFNHLQQFGLASGAMITMKALVTINGRKYVECYEDSNRYNPEDLTKLMTRAYEPA
jgi:hypothetical protein